MARASSSVDLRYFHLLKKKRKGTDYTDTCTETERGGPPVAIEWKHPRLQGRDPGVCMRFSGVRGAHAWRPVKSDHLLFRDSVTSFLPLLRDTVKWELWVLADVKCRFREKMAFFSSRNQEWLSLVVSPLDQSLGLILWVGGGR